MQKNHSPTSWLRWGTVAMALAIPLAASAQQAFTRSSANVRAGPGGNYPVVTMIGPGQPLELMGCTAGYGWCDVVLPDGLRGWVYAPSVAYPYQGAQVPIASYGAVIGVPIVTFAIGSYWGSYYRDRPWYGEPRYWGGRPPPPPGPGWRPPPPPHAGWQPRPPPPGWHGGPGPRPPGWNGGGRPPDHGGPPHGGGGGGHGGPPQGGPGGGGHGGGHGGGGHGGPPGGPGGGPPGRG